MTPEFVKTYLALVEAGIPAHLAAESRGVSRPTLFVWLTRGGHHRHSHNPGWVSPEDAEEPFKSFTEATLEAEAKAHNIPAQAAYRRAEKDPEFALKWLRARHPDDWNPSRNTPPRVLVQEGTQPLQVTFEDFLRIQKLKEEQSDG